MDHGPRATRSTDLEPWIVDRVPRLKLRGSHLVDAEPGLLGLVAGSGSIWSEGWGVCWGVLAAWTGAGDGWVEAKLRFFIYLLIFFSILVYRVKY